MVDKINPIFSSSQKFSNKGMKLADLKDNKLLFDYFKQTGFDESSVIYSTDIDKLKEKYDVNDNGKFSKKEAREIFGRDNSGKDIRKAIKGMKEIEQTAIKSDVTPVRVDTNENDIYSKEGTLLSNHLVNKDGSKEDILFLDGQKTKIQKHTLTSADGKNVHSVEYLDGDVTKPQLVIAKDGEKEVKTKYDYFNGSLNSTRITSGNDETTIIYQNINNRPEPKRVVETFKSDPNSCKVTVNGFDSDGKFVNRSVEYSGAKIDTKTQLVKEESTFIPDTEVELTNVQTFLDKSTISKENKYDEKGTLLSNSTAYTGSKVQDGVVKEDTVFSKDGKPVEKTVTYKDNSQKHFQDFDGKMHEVFIDENGGKYVKMNVPEGWGMKKIASTYGIEVEELLKANVDKNGKPLYHTNDKGVNYFYINDEVKIPNPKKMPESLSEADTVKKDGTVHKEGHAGERKEPVSGNKAEHVNEGKEHVYETHQEQKSKKAPGSRKKTTEKKNGAVAGRYGYVGLNDPINRPLVRPVNIADPVVAVKKARIRAVGRNINENNLNNTFRKFYNDHHGMTLASAVIHCSRNNKEKCLPELEYLKKLIGGGGAICPTPSGKKKHYVIPKRLYSFVPYKGQSRESVIAAARIYEQVFGKGSSGVKI